MLLKSFEEWLFSCETSFSFSWFSKWSDFIFSSIIIFSSRRFQKAIRDNKKRYSAQLRFSNRLRCFLTKSKPILFFALLDRSTDYMLDRNSNFHWAGIEPSWLQRKLNTFEAVSKEDLLANYLRTYLATPSQFVQGFQMEIVRLIHK